MNNATRDFLKTVHLAFPVFQENEKRFLRDLEDSVNAYAEQYPNCSIEDLTEQFGEPKDIVNTYFDNMEPSMYFAIMKQARYMKTMTYAIIIFLLLMIAISLGFLWQAKNTYKGEYIQQYNEQTLNDYLIHQKESL